MIIYLAHNIRDRLWVREWGDDLEKKFPKIKVWNPFYDGSRDDIAEIDAGVKKLYDEGLDFKKIVERDLEMVRKSDALVAIITSSESIGTIFEIAYARTIGVPVYLCILDKEKRSHPWLRYYGGENIFYSLEELEEELGRIGN